MARASKRTKTAAASRAFPQLKKAPSGIAGFDEITGGGLPAGRPTIVCGGPGCGKTMFAMEFLDSRSHGIRRARRSDDF